MKDTIKGILLVLGSFLIPMFRLASWACVPIMSNLIKFDDFVIFHSCNNTLIFQSCTLCFQELWKDYLAFMDVGIIGQTTLKPLFTFYVDFFYLYVI